MGQISKINWLTNAYGVQGASWNPIRGCQKAARFSGPGLAFEGLAKRKKNSPRWTGEVRFIEESLFDPLRWSGPRRIFVNSMSDLFYSEVKTEWINQIFAVMSLSLHTFLFLTKRPERMRYYLNDPQTAQRVQELREKFYTKTFGFRAASLRHCPPAGGSRHLDDMHPFLKWPLDNVLAGVSVEDQETANERLPLLMDAKACLRWASYEPAIGPVSFATWGQFLNFVVVGGESKQGRQEPRPMDIGWAYSTLAFCRRFRIPFHMKQLGHVVARRSNAATRAGDLLTDLPPALRIREFPLAE